MEKELFEKVSQFRAWEKKIAQLESEALDLSKRQESLRATHTLECAGQLGAGNALPDEPDALIDGERAIARMNDAIKLLKGQCAEHAEDVRGSLLQHLSQICAPAAKFKNEVQEAAEKQLVEAALELGKVMSASSVLSIFSTQNRHMFEAVRVALNQKYPNHEGRGSCDLEPPIWQLWNQIGQGGLSVAQLDRAVELDEKLNALLA